MMRLLSRIVVIAVSSSVVVPYTAAMLCHLLYSRQPLKARTFLRSLHPKRVYALSVVLVQKLSLNMRYAPLYLQWRQYYITADPGILVKNLAYGRNNCCLDLHLPAGCRVSEHKTKRSPKPVLLFVYGGAWASGDKNMYGSLCNQLANSLDMVVCCPNYSTYPQGCVDDMIQDIVDSIQWIYDYVQDYGGDKDKVMIVGHSAGAHLATMALLELLHDQRLHTGPFPPDVSAAASMFFHESHYGRLIADSGLLPVRDPLEESSGSSESFAVVSENGNGDSLSASAQSGGFLAQSTTESMVEVSPDDVPPLSPLHQPAAGEQPESGEQPQPKSEEQAEESKTETLEKPLDVMDGKGDSASGAGAGGEVKAPKAEGGEGEEDSCEEEDDNDSVVTVRPKEIERHATLIDLASSIKAFVGLAGVYHIGDHYNHEEWRGVAMMSGMCPAMYGPDHFERFSPTTILLSLDAPISLPRMVLVHGTADYVVPVTSSQKLADVLARASANVSLRVIPDCDHFDICFDLMKPSRHYHSAIMTILMETARSVF